MVNDDEPTDQSQTPPTPDRSSMVSDQQRPVTSSDQHIQSNYTKYSSSLAADIIDDDSQTSYKTVSSGTNLFDQQFDDDFVHDDYEQQSIPSMNADTKESNIDGQQHNPKASDNGTSSKSDDHPCGTSKEIIDTQGDQNDQRLTTAKKTVLFDTVTIYHFTRSQGFGSIPSQGGSTLGMKRRHFLRRKLSVDLYEEVRRRSRREILLKIRYERDREKKESSGSEEPHSNESTPSTSSSTSNATNSDSDEDVSFSDYSDVSDSELESDNYIFLQPIGIKLRRSLLRASGVCRIDPKEKKECKIIRDSRERNGCKCVNQCIPGLCECSVLGVNCHVDREAFPCGCISNGCRNPEGRTEFDVKRVKGHLYEKLFRVGIG